MVLWSMKMIDSKFTFLDFCDQLDLSERQPVVKMRNPCSVTGRNFSIEEDTWHLGMWDQSF